MLVHDGYRPGQVPRGTAVGQRLGGSGALPGVRATSAASLADTPRLLLHDPVTETLHRVRQRFELRLRTDRRRLHRLLQRLAQHDALGRLALRVGAMLSRPRQGLAAQTRLCAFSTERDPLAGGRPFTPEITPRTNGSGERDASRPEDGAAAGVRLLVNNAMAYMDMAAPDVDEDDPAARGGDYRSHA